MAEQQRYIATVDVDTEREDLGVQKIAFTANPAIIIKGVAFAAEQPDKTQAKDAVLMRIAAPVLVPTEIYRKADGGHTLIFTAEEIAGIQQDFMKRLNNANPLFKNEHTDKGSSPAYILETWIVNDAATDKANTVFGLDVPAGSWVVIIQVTDRAYYDKLVKDGATGLSIEGFLGHKLELSDEGVKSGKMKIIKKEDGVQLSMVEQLNKWEMEVDNSEFNEGDTITTTNDEGVKRSVGSGEFILPDGRSAVTDSEGVIQKIKDANMAAEGEAVKVGLPDGTYKDADGKEFKIKDGKVVTGEDAELSDEEKAKEGEEVEMTDEELEDGSMFTYEGELAAGSKTSAKDGEYKTKSGKTITVKDGAITEVKDKPVEELADDNAGATINSYSKEEVDAKMEELRTEFADKLAEFEVRMEATGKAEGANGEAVAMSAEEKAVSNLQSLRAFFTGQRG